MGKTYRKDSNYRFKKDKNFDRFKKSNKFKNLKKQKNNSNDTKPEVIEEQIIE
jgi:hypothetical protein